MITCVIDVVIAFAVIVIVIDGAIPLATIPLIIIVVPLGRVVYIIVVIVGILILSC